MAVDANVHDSMDSRWEFNEEVTRVFDDMLERSIPQYQTMRATVRELGLRFIRPRSTVVDLGCSRGEALAPFVGARDGCRYVGCEVSEPMRAAAQERFQGRDDVTILDIDLRDGYPVAKRTTSLTLAVLTLQFIPINYRQRIIADAFRSTLPGGALILVEKVLGEGHEIDSAMVDTYHDAKRQAGYSQEEVERKRLALEGVLVPVTAAWNEELLRNARFAQVDCFWRWMNFAAWVAVRG
jgi:tRNA (cmo5U34)-methyltransferase